MDRDGSAWDGFGAPPVGAAESLSELVADCERLAPMCLGPGPRFPHLGGPDRSPAWSAHLRLGGRAAFEAGATGLVGLPARADRGRRLLRGLEDYGT